MNQAVQDRRDTLWRLLHETPEGLTREELADASGVKSATVKTDLKALSAEGKVVLRQGGSVEGQPHAYRRAWFAVAQQPQETPLYDALLLAVENGASVTLTVELLQKLRADLRG